MTRRLLLLLQSSMALNSLLIVEEEKKWRIRDEKVRIFKERQEEAKRVKALIAKRSKEVIA